MRSKQVMQAVSIADLRLLARRYLPDAVFAILDGANEDGRAMALNVSRLREYALIPRVLRNTGPADQSIILFGKKYSSCVGIAPTGFVNVMRRDIELMLADTALEAKIPMILSGASGHSLETVARRAPGFVWSQLYAAEDPQINSDQLKRACDAGVDTLVWTVDQAAPPKNEHAARCGLSFPPRLTLASKLEALTHPTWVGEYLRGGMTQMNSWSPYVAPGSPPFAPHKLFAEQRFGSLNWRTLETLRKLWKGPLVVKGIMHPDDARQAAEMDADGVIVSNHGGLGLDRSPAAIDMLPAVVEAVGHRLTVMFDSGVRRGADIAVARCMGAKAVFVGRPTLYGAVAGKQAGALRAIDILKDELDRAMRQIGCYSGDAFAPDFIKS